MLGLPPPAPNHFPVHCWHLALRTGGGAWEVCHHTAERNCDLRVVGLTDYGLLHAPVPVPKGQ